MQIQKRMERVQFNFPAFSNKPIKNRFQQPKDLTPNPSEQISLENLLPPNLGLIPVSWHIVKSDIRSIKLKANILFQLTFTPSNFQKSFF